MKGMWLRRWSIGIFLLLASGGSVYVWGDADSFLFRVFQPLVGRAWVFGRHAADAGSILTRSLPGVEEVRRLRVENKSLAARIVLLEDIQRENADLRAMLGRETEDIQFIYARIVGQSPSRVDDYVIVDAGSVEGVEAGMLVFAGDAVHIGSIAQVAAHTAVIKLISHVDEKTRVNLPEAHVSSVAVGKGAGVLEIQVPASIPVREGEPLLSVGPPDFLVGYVEKVEKSDAGPFQIVRTSHPMSLADLQRVFLTRLPAYESR